MAASKSYGLWRDRAGRFSTLKTATFIAIVLPAAWLAAEGSAGWLGPEPWTEALHQSGTWAVRLLLVSMAVTPFRRIWQWGQLIAVRRMLGVTALAYATLHLALYVGQQHGDLAHVAGEIASRFYLTVGFAALLGLAVLGATSTDGAIRRLGGKRWQALHRGVYGIAPLALFHFMLQAKLDIAQPVLTVGLFVYLMGWRLMQRRKLGDRVPALVGLAAAAAVCTALAEAGWYGVVNHRSFADVLAANLSLDDGPRASAIVLAAGFAVAATRFGLPALALAGKRIGSGPRGARNAAALGG